MREPRRRPYERELAWYEAAFPGLFAERMSVLHPDFDRLEGAFWFAQSPPRNIDEFIAQGQLWAARDEQEPSAPDDSALDAFDSYLKSVSRYHDDLAALVSRLFDRRDDEAVFFALDRLGLDALREPSPPEVGVREQEERHLHLIRRQVWRRIERWYWGARLGSASQRAQAASTLRRVGEALVPDRRGQRKSTVSDPAAVYEQYCRKLFRLLRALRLLREWPWRGSRDERIEAVAESCGLTVRELRSYLTLHAFDTPVGTPGSPEQTACESVADELWLDWKTVAKIRAAMERRVLPPPSRLSPK